MSSKESRKKNERQIKFDFLGECKNRDGKDTRDRAEAALAAMPEKERLRIRFFGLSHAMIAHGQADGSEEWVVCAFFDAFKWGENSLAKTLGGNFEHLYNMSPGETRSYLVDIHGKPVFKVQRYDFRKHSRAELVSEANENAHVLEDCMRRMKLRRDLLVHNNNSDKITFWTVQMKNGDGSFNDDYDIRPAISMSDIIHGPTGNNYKKGRCKIGQVLYAPRRPLELSDLPSEVGEERELQMCLGRDSSRTFVVKCVTVDDYLSAETEFNKAAPKRRMAAAAKKEEAAAAVAAEKKAVAESQKNWKNYWYQCPKCPAKRTLPNPNATQLNCKECRYNAKINPIVLKSSQHVGRWTLIASSCLVDNSHQWSDEEIEVLVEVVEDYRTVTGGGGKKNVNWANAAPAVDAKLKKRCGKLYRKFTIKQMKEKLNNLNRKKRTK